MSEKVGIFSLWEGDGRTENEVDDLGGGNAWKCAVKTSSKKHIFCVSSSLSPQNSVGAQPVPDAQRYQAFKIHVMSIHEQRYK